MKAVRKPGRPSFPGLLFAIPGGLLPGAFVLGLLVFVPFFRMFVVEEAGGGGIVFLRPFTPDYEFSLSYIHSVNKSEIVDLFAVGRDGSIVLRGSRFSSFGAGVATEDAGTFSGSGGFLEYSGIGRRIPDLRVFAGTEADHRFKAGDGGFRFRDLAAPQTSLRFRVRRVSAAEMISYRARKGVLHEKRP